MPSTIPYSPSLVLGSIVHPAAMDTLLAMSALQGPVDAAQDTLNSFISLQRGLEMTASELVNMNIDPKDLLNKIHDVKAELQKAAVNYATTRVQQELQMQPCGPRCNWSTRAWKVRSTTSAPRSRRCRWPPTR